MKTFFGSLYHLFYSSGTDHQIWCAGLLIVMLILSVLHHKWRDDKNKILIWRWLCLLPLIICIVHFAVYVIGCPMLAEEFIPLYIIAVLALIPIFFANRKIGYRISFVLTGILTMLCGVNFMFSSPNVHNFSNKSYTDSFHSLVQTMDKEYVLKEWKNVDFSDLEEKYMPLVKEAESEQDEKKFGDAITMFCNEIHDGHIGVYTKNSTDLHDYGLGLVKLDSGEVIAVCTADEANNAGITDGTVITKWNGKPILQAAEEIVGDMGTPVKENGEMLSVILLPERSDHAEVSFIDKNGDEQTVILKDNIITPTDLKEHHSVMDTQKLLVRKFAEEENFGTKMLGDNCGYLLMNAEHTDNDMQDTLGYLTGDHKWAREMFREKLRALKEQGMETLVIDLRGNRGGLDEIACALCSLLTTEDQFGLGVGIRKNGAYYCVSEHNIRADGEFADLKVVALTNFDCGSAGDGAVLYLSKLPNVTVAGITDPCGCNQETGGLCVLAEDVQVYYPTGLVLNDDDEPNIDTTADRISRNPVEVHITLDRDAAMKIFRDKEDYELDWAIRYLEEHKQ